MKKICTSICMMLVAMMAMASTTFTFTGDGDKTQTKDGITLAIAKAGGANDPVWNVNSSQLRMYANNTLTVSGNGITEIKLTWTKQGGKDYAAVTCNTGSIASGGASSSNTDPKTDTWTGDATQVIFTLGTGQRVVVEVEVTTGGTSTGGQGQGQDQGQGQGQGSGLVTDYTYGEPTIVAASALTAELGNNKNYSFIENNILVNCNLGAIVRESTTSPDYFGCNAGQSMTITAAKAIKGIAIDGYVKKGFDASVDNGTIEFLSDSDDDVEGEPVILIKDINATSVTISAVKQMRCYVMYIYFDANPEDELGEGGGEEGDYNFDYEPAETTTLTISFDELGYEDESEYYGYAVTSLSFASDDYEAELAVFTAATAGATVLPVGTYPINASYAENTVQASPGGDDMYDYPSYIMTDFEFDSQYQEWYYNTSYYLVSGSLVVEADPAGVKMTINATTAKGSTVHAVFVGAAVNYGDPDTAVEEVEKAEGPSAKRLVNGRVLILREGKVYDVLGSEVR